MAKTPGQLWAMAIRSIFYQRYHGISTTEGEYANLKEGFK